MSTEFKIIKSRKDISSILTTLLLIIVAVAAITVTHTWILTSIDDTQDKAGFILTETNILFNSTGIFIDVQNIGTIAGQVSEVYIGLSETGQSRVTANQTLPADINPSQKQTLTVKMANYAWATGNTYYIRVVPNTGAALSFTAKP